MKSLFGLVNERRTLFLLFFYILLSFVLMTLNDPFNIRGMKILVLQAMNMVKAIEYKFTYWHNLEQENSNLRQQLLEVSIENQRIQESMLENIRLRRLLKFKEENKINAVAANVIGFGQEQTIRSLILDVGTNEGINKNMVVVTEKGLVGKILQAEPEQSQAQILMDRNALVSVRLQKSRETGVVGWSGNLWLDLNYIPKDIVVEVGELVITSGLSQIYPEGIKVGVVGEVEENKYELFKKIKVKPAVEFNKLEEVFVLTSSDSLKGEGKIAQ
jgi:rod shape-determining protein MreC